MPIWNRELNLESLNRTSHHTLVEHLRIRFTAIEDEALAATMPVTSETKQPYGMLHGGASLVLAETLGSVAANLCVQKNQFCVGLEINGNHVRAVRDGIVTGRATPIHIGRQTQVWSVAIKDEQERLVCSSRITLMVKELNQ